MTMTATTTTLGTPASPKWDDDWLARVDRVEQQLGHRICGAHTPAWTPCKLTSTHPNGRCRFHGGAQGIGAPDGNRNAWVHGLYSRRLQQCGQHCPLWNHCPMAGDDVLDLHPTERPHCVYEQDEYDTTLAQLTNTDGPQLRNTSPRSMGGSPMRDEDTANSPLKRDAASPSMQHATSPSTQHAASPSMSFPRRRESTVESNDTTSPSDTDQVHIPSNATPQDASAHSKRDSRLRGNDKASENDNNGTNSNAGWNDNVETPALDLLRVSNSPRDPNLIERNIALFQVMLTRAQAALRIHPLTDETEILANRYQMRSTRVGALLQAQLHIARELRQWLKLLPAFDPRTQAKLAAPNPPPQPQGLHERMQDILKETEGILEQSLEECDDSDIDRAYDTDEELTEAQDRS